MEYIGKRFGQLIVRERAGFANNAGRMARYLCVCDCGNLAIVNSQKLRKGEIKSCGCGRRRRIGELNRRHSMYTKRIYGNWQKMRDRCNNPNARAYKHYGGRGISVCSRWATFEMFFQDMGHPPSDKHSLERIDNDGPYSKDNCRWATPNEQARNRRTTHRITINGITRSLADWVEFYETSYDLVWGRLKRGWNVEDALLQPKTEYK